jgi:transposase
MDAAPPLPSEVLASLPPAVAALIAWQSEQIRLLTARVAEREGQLNQNSSHSSKPPSADPPSAKPVPARTPSGKKRGGPPGHPKHERTILPPDEIRDHKPSPGGGCRRPLTGDDPQPLIEQVVDPPEKRRPVIHHRHHTLTGPDGRATTAAVASPETRTGFGPKLQAVTAYLSGVGRMGKRPIRPFGDDVLGIPIRRGSVSHRAASTARALAPIPAEARSAIEGRDANVEETGWKHGRKKAWRWVAVTPLLSVFRIHRHRSRAAFESLMGPSLGCGRRTGSRVIVHHSGCSDSGIWPSQSLENRRHHRHAADHPRTTGGPPAGVSDDPSQRPCPFRGAPRSARSRTRRRSEDAPEFFATAPHAPHAKPVPPPPRSKKKRGGQPGHPKHPRPLLPTDQCQAVLALKPEAGRRCGELLSGSDAAPLRHPVGELPEIRPLVTADQRHRLPCAGCGTATGAVPPTGVPESQAGPQLVAFTAWRRGCFRPSKRRVAWFLETVLHPPGSPGGVVQLQNQATAARQPADEEWKRARPGQAVVGGDETPTKPGSAKAWLWTGVAALLTVFTIRPRRANTTVTELVGEAVPGVGTCDRAKRYWCGGRLQWCWPHRKRDFQAWIDHPDRGVKRLGHDLMRPTRKRFAWWSRCRDGTLSRAEFEEHRGSIRREVNGLLRRGSFSGKRGVAGSCREWWECLGRFVDVAGVEPTNNASERALRPAVIGRRWVVRDAERERESFRGDVVGRGGDVSSTQAECVRVRASGGEGFLRKAARAVAAHRAVNLYPLTTHEPTLFSRSLHPVLDGGEGNEDPVIPPEMPGGNSVRQAVFHYQTDGQGEDALGGMTTGGARSERSALT